MIETPPFFILMLNFFNEQFDRDLNLGPSAPCTTALLIELSGSLQTTSLIREQSNTVT
jgi:hypothetical protein